MDYVDWYNRISAPFRGRIAGDVFRMLDAVLVWVFVAEYVLTICTLIQKAHILQLASFDIAPGLFEVSLVKALVVPAVVLVAISVLQVKLNKPRPYEEHDIQPLLARDLVAQRKSGKSLPSRHMSCAVAIAFLFCLSMPGAVTVVVQILLCAAIAFTRVVGGVHYPRDILAAVALSLCCSAIGFLLIP